MRPSRPSRSGPISVAAKPPTVTGSSHGPATRPLEYNRMWQMRLWLFGVFFFLYAPLVALIAFSFNDSKRNIVWRGFTLDYYQEAFQRSGPDGRLRQFADHRLSGHDHLARHRRTRGGSLMALPLRRQNRAGGRLHPAARWCRKFAWASPCCCSSRESYLGPTISSGRFSLGSIIIAHVSFCFPFVALVVGRETGELQQGAGGGGARPRRQRLAGLPRRPAAAYAPGADCRRPCSPSRCRSTTS